MCSSRNAGRRNRFSGNYDRGPAQLNDAFFAANALLPIGNVIFGSSKYIRNIGGDVNTGAGTIDTSVPTPAELALQGRSVGAVLVLNQPFTLSGSVTIFSNIVVSVPFAANSSSSLTVDGTASFASGATLVFSATQSGTFVVVRAGQVVGSEFLTTVIEPGPGACSATGSATVTQTTISVVVQVITSCGSGGLSPGALAGIIVGSIVGVTLLVILLVLLGRYVQRRRDSSANRAIAACDIKALREM